MSVRIQKAVVTIVVVVLCLSGILLIVNQSTKLTQMANIIPRQEELIHSLTNDKDLAIKKITFFRTLNDTLTSDKNKAEKRLADSTLRFLNIKSIFKDSMSVLKEERSTWYHKAQELLTQVTILKKDNDSLKKEVISTEVKYISYVKSSIDKLGPILYVYIAGSVDSSAQKWCGIIRNQLQHSLDTINLPKLYENKRYISKCTELHINPEGGVLFLNTLGVHELSGRALTKAFQQNINTAIEISRLLCGQNNPLENSIVDMALANKS